MTTPAHPLQPDLAAIREFGKLSSHDQRTEAQAAMALYEDICWRAAMVTLPPVTAHELADLEAAAATLMRRYMATELAAAAFWQDLARLVERMDAVLGEGLARSSAAQRALDVARGLRQRLAEAELPEDLGVPARASLDLIEREAAGLMDGKLAPEAVEALVARERAIVEEALAAAPQDPHQRLHRLTQQALATPAPAFLAGPLVRALVAANAAAAAGEPVAVDALEQLLVRVARFRDEHDGADRRYRQLRAEATGEAFPPAFRTEALDQLRAMEALMVALEAGTLATEAFHERFELAARHLEGAIHLATEADPAAPARRLAEARARVAATALPPFVQRTVRELLAQLATSVQAADVAGFDDLMQQVDDCLVFGEDLLREETAALLRFRDLEERARTSELSPLLAGPVSDQLELLRGMLRRLDGGLYPLASFHVDFEQQVMKLDVLLSWQDMVEVHHGA